MNHTDAVVPDARDSSYTGLPPIPYHHSSLTNGLPAVFGGKAFEVSGLSMPAGSYGTNAVLPHGGAAMVPQLAPQSHAAFNRLTAAQQSELEMARRRAQKAAEGKRANATAARRAKRKAHRAELSDHDDDEPSSRDMQGEGGGESDIEAKLLVVEDQKEAKRLKRLLRNRVSAQQARERKKSYVSDLEAKSKQQEQQVGLLEQRIKTLERENGMLRQVIKSMQGNSDSGGTSSPTKKGS